MIPEGDNDAPSVPTEPPDSRIGQLLSDRYRVDAVIAKGGMGTVYRGEHVRMRKQVAIKLIQPVEHDADDRVARFEREAIAGAHVHHPNVAAATDFGQLEDGTHFLVLEYVDGIPLRQLMTAAGPLSPQRAVRIGRQIAAALGAAHQAGILHRDLKPANVIVVEREDDLTKVIDFGLAQVDIDRLPRGPGTEVPKPPRQFLTAAGLVLGTVAYMAPETALGMKSVDARSDLYALGIVLYELLAGKHPFDSRNPVELFLHHKNVTAPPFAERSPELEVPKVLEALILRLLEKDPADRYQTAAEVVTALDLALLADPIAAVGQTGSVRPAQASLAPLSPPSLSFILRDRAEKVLAAARDLATQLGSHGWMWQGRRIPYALAPALGIVILAGIIHLARGHGGANTSPTAGDADERDGAVEQVRAIQREIDHMDAVGWKARVMSEAKARDFAGGATALLALAELDPPAFHDRDTRGAARDIAAGIAGLDAGPLVDKVFGLLSTGLGTDGLDILYDVVRWKPGTKGAKRAAEILRQPEVVERSTPVLRLLFEMHEVTCDRKRDFFARAADEGDERVLLELSILQEADCPRRKDPCCYKNSRALADAIKTLRTKLRSAPREGAPEGAPTTALAADGGSDGTTARRDVAP